MRIFRIIMKIKSYIPFLTVPTAVAWFCLIAYELLGNSHFKHFEPDPYGHAIGRVILSIMVMWGLISGLIHWNKPYVIADDDGIRVMGRPFSRHPSIILAWRDIKRHLGRTFLDFRVECTDGRIIKIPINGMSGSGLNSLLSMIENKSESANNKPDGVRQPAVGSPKPSV